MAAIDIPPPLPPTGAQWHFIEGDTQKGPKSTEEMKSLLLFKTLTPESQVWKRGMEGWRSIRETELVASVADLPPPVPGDQMSNTLVWIVAMLPLVSGLIDASLALQPGVALDRAIAPHLGGSYAEPEIPWFVAGLINTVLLVWDERRLKRAGYSTRWTFGTAIALAPVYLFIRAKQLRQRPSYAITFLALFVFSLIIVASARA